MTTGVDPSEEPTVTRGVDASADAVPDVEGEEIQEPGDGSRFGRLLHRLRRRLSQGRSGPPEAEEAIAELVVASDVEAVPEVRSDRAATTVVEEAKPGDLQSSAPGRIRMRAQSLDLTGIGLWAVALGLLLVAALAVAGIVLPRGASPEGDIYVDLAVLYEAVGRTEESAEALNRALELGVRDAGAWAKLGEVYFTSREYGEAVVAFEGAVAIEPDNAEGHLGLARSYAAVGRREDAITHYEIVVEGDVEDKDDIYIETGLNYVALGNHEEARNQYDMAVQIQPGNGRALFLTGESYQAQGEHGAAIPYYRRAIETKTNPPWKYYVGLGRSLAAAGEHTQALAEYDRALDANPNQPDPHFWSGEAYRSLGLYEEAVGAHETAIGMRPDSASYYVGLAQDYLAMDDCEGAVPILSKVLELSPDNEIAIQGLAACESR